MYPVHLEGFVPTKSPSTKGENCSLINTEKCEQKTAEAVSSVPKMGCKGDVTSHLQIRDNF